GWLVGGAGTAANGGSTLDGVDPLAQLVRQLVVAVIAVGAERLQSSGVLPGLEDERGVDVADVERALGRHLHDDVTSGQLCHVTSVRGCESEPTRPSPARDFRS